MVLDNLLILVCVAGALSRDIGKPMPVISNSLVNFGKMDISFYLSDKFKDLVSKRDFSMSPSSSLSSPHYNSIFHDSPKDEPCPCSSLRNLKDPFSSHPSEMLNKILMSNDLFSFNKELISSTLCCDSHENVQEEGVFFEFSPRQNQMLANPAQASQHLMPSLAQIFENVIPRRPTLPIESIKSPAIDIFLFPKKKNQLNERNADFFLKKKAEIHPVGENDMKTEIKAISFAPVITNKTSVKKDLGKKKPVEGKPSDSENNIVGTSTNKSIFI